MSEIIEEEKIVYNNEGWTWSVGFIQRIAMHMLLQLKLHLRLTQIARNSPKQIDSLLCIFLSSSEHKY